MAGAASAHQAATASREQTSHQRAVRTRRSSADPQRAQQGATAAAVDAPAALDSLSRLQQLANASPQVTQLRRLQALADSRCAPVSQLAGGPEEEELVQGKFATAQPQPQLQQAPRANNTGLPDQLKSGIESLSGLSMDHVRVHYNSAQPAQLNALAYAQGSDIHLAPGQERHLPHEAWHVVQQAQGRVRPTMQMKEGELVNDDVGLESEADVMGSKALEGGHRVAEAHRSVSMSIETALAIEGDATNSPDENVANNDSAPLANGRGSAQRGGTEAQRIADQRPEAALQLQLQAWGDVRGVGGKKQNLNLSFAHEIVSQSTQAKSVVQRVFNDEELPEWAELDETELDGLTPEARQQIAAYKKQQNDWKEALDSRQQGISCVSWNYGGATYHINLGTETYHVTKEVIPKVHYFFKGFGDDITDAQATAKEGHGNNNKKVFTKLPKDVQFFIKKNFQSLLPTSKPTPKATSKPTPKATSKATSKPTSKR